MILILILIFASCDINNLGKAKPVSNKIELPSKLNEVMSTFHQERCIQGVPSITIHSYCDSKIAELWCTKGWAELENRRPAYYAEYKGFTYLVFDELSFIKNEQISVEELSKLVGVQLEEDIGLPPRTGFPHRWLYRLDYSADKFYSMVDSLFKYDDDHSFNRNLKLYTGDHFCK